MQIDIISDVVCPWCYIGKRNLEKALAEYADRSPDESTPVVKWHPFQLNPELAVEGMPREEYTATKFGGAERAREIYERVARAGKEAGIDFHFDDIKVQPNTVDAHQLIALADEFDVQDAVVESLFNGYFLEGRDLSERKTLLDLAEHGGLPRADAERCLTEQRFRNQVDQAQHRAFAIGVQGVPFFIFNQRLAAPGAQPPEVLIDAMQQAQQAPAESNT